MNKQDELGPTYFISYCTDDVSEEFLEYLIWLLRKSSPQQVRPIVYTRLKLGGDIQAFMHKLDTVDAVIILLSPGYLQRVHERKGGVYSEFSSILDRLEKCERQRERGQELYRPTDYLEIIPLL